LPDNVHSERKVEVEVRVEDGRLAKKYKTPLGSDRPLSDGRSDPGGRGGGGKKTSLIRGAKLWEFYLHLFTSMIFWSSYNM
jgi:hypothetical protein